jgi:hypothetical protein
MRTLADLNQEMALIIKEVKAMRKLQKDYFRAVYEKDYKRKDELLPKSKFQEKKVDEMIENYQNLGQSKLF